MSNFTQHHVQKFCQDAKFINFLTYVQETDVFLLYDPKEHYHKMIEDEIDFENIVYEWAIQNVVKNISKTLIKDMVYQIKMVCYKKKKEMPSGFIAFEDKDLDLEMLDFVPHSIANYAHHKIKFHSSQLEMGISKFDKFIKEILVTPDLKTDNELISVLQEMMGYYLVEDLNPNVVFFLVGKGANGKSQIINLLKKIVGLDQVGSYSIQNLTTNKFAPVNLVGKKLNLCSEEESKYMKADKFKAMITHDTIECEKKYGAKFICFTPQTKFLFATNNMPGFDSIGPAIKRRVKIIKFFKEIPEEKQDKNLLAKMEEELPGIIRWALEGFERLRINNYVFTTSQNMGEAYSELEEVISSPVQFLRENYIESEKGFIATNDLYEHYRDWCTGAGGRQKKSSYNFSADLNIILKLPSIIKWSADHGKNMRGRQLIHKEYADPISSVGGRDEERPPEFNDIPI